MEGGWSKCHPHWSRHAPRGRPDYLSGTRPAGFAIVGGTGHFRQAEGELQFGTGRNGSDVFEVIS
jgi:hypothetical protein